MEISHVVVTYIECDSKERESNRKKIRIKKKLFRRDGSIIIT